MVEVKASEFKINCPTISAEGNRIQNVADPVDPQDVATKNYVDTHAGGAAKYYTTVTIPSSSPYEVTITHNLNTLAPIYVVYDDSTGEQIEPESAVVVDENTLKLTFGVEDAGKTIRVAVI